MSGVEGALVLTRREAIFLATLLGENMLFGISDPFSGWLAEQVEREWVRCRNEMLKKGLLEESEGRARVPVSVETALRPLTRPGLYVVAMEPGMRRHLFFSIDGDAHTITCVEQDDNMVHIRSLPCDDIPTASRLIIDRLAIPRGRSINAQKWCIPATQFAQAFELDDSGAHVQALSLFGRIIHGEITQDAMNALLSPSRKILLNIGNAQNIFTTVTSVALFSGSHDLSALYSYTERGVEWLRIEHVSREEFTAELARMIDGSAS
jgi:hypothetical protein